jgi:hypothetical protein
MCEVEDICLCLLHERSHTVSSTQCAAVLTIIAPECKKTEMSKYNLNLSNRSNRGTLQSSCSLCRQVQKACTTARCNDFGKTEHKQGFFSYVNHHPTHCRRKSHERKYTWHMVHCSAVLAEEHPHIKISISSISFIIPSNIEADYMFISEVTSGKMCSQRS